MTTAEQHMSIAIGELRCIEPSAAATPERLQALTIARRAIDELLAATVDELRTQGGQTGSWEQIAAATGARTPEAARKQFSRLLGNGAVEEFWTELSPRFAWDFLPVPFLHELYVAWLSSRQPSQRPLLPKAFTRRLSAIASPSDWKHMRVRADSLLRRTEPLMAHVSWRPAFDGRAIWGFRRIG